MFFSRLLSGRLNFPLFIFLLFSVLIITTATFLYRQFHSVEILLCENGEISRVNSKAYHVKDFLEEQGIALKPMDRISLELHEPLVEGMQIIIEKAFPVNITTETGTFKHYTHASSVFEVLKELSIPASSFYVEPDFSAAVYPEKEIFIYRLIFATETESEEIPYMVKKQMDDTLYKGRTRVVQEGKKGVKELKFRVVYAGGKELSRDLIGEEIVLEPVPSIVAVGAKPLPKPPAVVLASRGETVEGLASWYGTEFHGRKTSSDEIFDQYDFTAAHRTLPFGTYVRVTFLKTGKSVTVRINDRGPHNPERIIDLSRAAAEAIGLKAHGVGKVKIEVVEVPDSFSK